MIVDDVKIVQGGAQQPRARVFADLHDNQNQAWRDHATFFTSAAHEDKVAQVTAIVTAFFPVRKALYVNRRANKGQPFTVIKVEQPQFPRMSKAQIDSVYREPLNTLGVEVVFSTASNSYLFRVR